MARKVGRGLREGWLLLQIRLLRICTLLAEEGREYGSRAVLKVEGDGGKGFSFCDGRFRVINDESLHVASLTTNTGSGG